MKKQFLLILLVFSCGWTFSQINYAPPVQWRYHDVPAFTLNGGIVESYPGTSTPLGSPQTIAESGEDWWYDIENIYEGVDHVGYIVSGFATWVNIGTQESQAPYNGCPELDRMDPSKVAGPDCIRPILDDEILSPKQMTVARYDLRGNMVWCFSYANAEEGAIAITPVTGGFVFTGWGTASRNIHGDPIYLNPTSSTSTDIVGIGGCADLRSKMLVGKIDTDGNLQWLNQYNNYDIGGSFTNEEVLKARSIGYDVIEKADGNYRIVGRCFDLNDLDDPFDIETAKNKVFVVDLNTDGQIINRALFGEPGKHHDAREITRIGNEYFITGQQGDFGETDAFLFKIDHNMNRMNFANDEWPVGSGFDAAVRYSTGGNNVGWDVKVLNNSKIAWAFIEDCNNCIAGGHNSGKGRIFLFENSPPYGASFIDLENVNTFGFSNVQAFDMKMGLTKTDDGGFACVTTYQVFEPNLNAPPWNDIITNLNGQFTSLSCNVGNHDPKFWNTNAYVAKFDEDGNLLWDKSIDIDDQAPQNYPGDWKKQECVYRITEADDGSLVYVGNTSHNKDDYYIAKIASDCCYRKFLEEDYDLFGHVQDGSIDIFSNTTWTPTSFGQSTVTVGGSIIIHDDATLTIDGEGTGLTMEFADGSKMPYQVKIIVEPGGKLIVKDNVTLTSLSECENTMWQGIEVWGDYLETEQSEDFQGVVDLRNDVTVENAIIGVAAVKRVGFTKDLTKTGGIVRIDQCTFRNNLIGVEMRPYDNGPEAGVDNKSTISRTDFVIDDALNDPEVAQVSTILFPWSQTRQSVPRAHQEFILLDGITGMKIRGNTFRLDDTNPYVAAIDDEWRGYGILSWDSDFRLSSFSTVLNDPNPIPNTLENLWIGVNCLPLGNMNDVVIDDNVFTNNHIGVSLVGSATFTRITNNHFDVSPRVGFPIEQANVAIWSRGATGLKIEKNEIFGTTGPSLPGSNAGIYIAESADGGGSAEIYRNDFDYLVVGTQSDFNNSLLEVDCNDFMNTPNEDVVNWHNTVSGTILDQGNCPTVPAPEVPVANEFLGTYNGTTSFHILNEGIGFGYNSYNITSYIPSVSTTLGLAPCFSATSINESEACPFRNAPPNFGEVESSIYAGLEELNELGDVVDGANTAGLVEFIENTEQGHLLKDELLNYTPYLSDEVVITLINKPGVDNWVVDQVLSDMQILSTEVLLALVNSPNEFPDYLIRDMVNMSSPVDESVLVACINRNKQLPDWVIKSILLSNSPLQDPTLIAALQKPDPLAKNVVRDVLKQNTPLSQAVDAVFQANGYPNWVYNQVYNSNVVAGDPDDKVIPDSPIDELEREITYKTKAISRDVTWVVSFYLDDDNFLPAVQILEDVNTVEGSCLLLPLLLETKDGQRLYQHILKIREDADLDPASDRSKSLYAFCDYYELMFEIRTQPGGLEAITQTQLNKVLQLSDLGVSISTNNRNLLAYLELKPLDELLLAPINIGNPTMAPFNFASEEHGIIPESSEESAFDLYPNPATNEVRIRYDINDLSELSYLKMYDLSGKLIYQELITDQHNEIVLRLDQYDKGVYLVNITTENGDNLTKKLVVH